MNMGAMIALVALSEALLHYFPWRLILKGRDLPRLIAYMLGVLGLVGPFTAWLLEQGEWAITQALWMVVIFGGASVLALYGLDHVIGMEWKVKEGAEREQAIREGIDGKGK